METKTFLKKLPIMTRIKVFSQTADRAELDTRKGIGKGYALTEIVQKEQSSKTK